MKITKEQIKAFDPCADGYKWYLEHGTEDLLETLLKVDGPHPEWARWLFVQLMNPQQRRRIAIFAAEQVLPFFENKYPKDARPRKAIEAAKEVLANDTKTNRDASADAAVAAHDAADATSAYAAYAATYAAYAADDDATAAAYAATYAAYAYATADAAYAAYVNTRKEMQERIIKEAVRILDGGGR